MLFLLVLLQASAAPATPMVEAQLSEKNGICVVALEGKTFSLPRGKPHSAEQQALEVTLAGLASSKASVQIAPFDKMSYRCMGGFIYLAQAAAVPIGFVSEPLPNR